jgi:predicted SprT family Zn-dependent metalloprotease
MLIKEDQLFPIDPNGEKVTGYGVTASSEVTRAAREEWLYRIAESLYPRFAELGFPNRPEVRIGVGHPSTGARGKRVGECNDACASKDKLHEIIISPKLDDSMEVAGVVAHELCHAHLQSSFPDENCGHGKKFKKLATGLGLTGKMRSTVPGETFKRSLQPIIDKIGGYPHGALDGIQTSRRRKVQSTRLKKVVCSSCEYTMRVTQKWIDTAIPRCPSPDCHMFGEEMEVA